MNLKKDRLLNEILKIFPTQKQAADAIGYSESRFSHALNKPGSKFLTKLESAGVETKQFLSSTDNKLNLPFDLISPASGVWLPVIKKLITGDPTMIFRDENKEPEPVFIRDWNKSERCYCLRVLGDSMISESCKSINDNDIVFCDMDAVILPGDVIVVSLKNGREMIKQFVPSNQEVILRSFNSNYPDIHVKKSDILVMHRVMGVVPPVRRF